MIAAILATWSPLSLGAVLDRRIDRTCEFCRYSPQPRLEAGCAFSKRGIVLGRPVQALQVCPCRADHRKAEFGVVHYGQRNPAVHRIATEQDQPALHLHPPCAGRKQQAPVYSN